MDAAVTTIEAEVVEEEQSSPEVVEETVPEIPPEVVVIPPSPIEVRDFVNNLKGIYSSYSSQRRRFKGLSKTVVSNVITE